MDANELYDPEFRELIKSKKQTVIIPVGSLEQHGAHLPLTTDSDIVTEVASRLAKKCGFIVFPTISYGDSMEHIPLFNASVGEINLIEQLLSIISTTAATSNHPKSIIVLNGHHGNKATVGKIERIFANPKLRILKNRKKEELMHRLTTGVKVKSYSYWNFMKREFDHAGFVETSIMLAISDKVKMKKAKKGLITKGMSEKEIQRIKKLSTESGGFPKVAKNGVWGDPTSATKKDGEKFLAEIVRNLAKECQS